jgi:outer membrane protein OmpA-like peptidoglycan-associated protein
MERFVRPKSLTLAAALLLAAPASAQIQPDVTVNPNASGTRVLLYPGGQYGRVMHPLLEPGERDPNAPILLHMPRKHRTAQAKPKPKVAAAVPPPAPAKQAHAGDTMPLSSLPDESAAKLVMDEPVKPTPVKPKPTPPKQVATAKPPPKQQAAKPPPPKPQGLPPAPSETDAFVLSGNGVESTQSAAVPPPAPAPAKPPPAAPTRTASVEPAAATELSKRNSIVFTPGAEEPPPSALDTIKGMTASLTAALWSGGAHIQLEAFGGKVGDKSSDARRLSLKRALIVRQLLIDDGIPSDRIVVRAMGGASGGALDRVDIFVAA